MAIKVDPNSISVGSSGEVTISDPQALARIEEIAYERFSPQGATNSTCNGTNMSCTNTTDCTTSNNTKCSNQGACYSTPSPTVPQDHTK